MTCVNIRIAAFLGGISDVNEFGFVDVNKGHPVLSAIDRDDRGDVVHVNVNHLDFINNEGLNVVFSRACFEHDQFGGFWSRFCGALPFSSMAITERTDVLVRFLDFIEGASTAQ